MPKFDLPARRPSKLQCKLLELTWNIGYLSTQEAIEHIYKIEQCHEGSETWRYPTNYNVISARSSIIKSVKNMVAKGWLEKPYLDCHFRLTSLGRAVFLDAQHRQLIPKTYYRQNYHKQLL